jgi:hypothetical protein
VSEQHVWEGENSGMLIPGGADSLRHTYRFEKRGLDY